MSPEKSQEGQDNKKSEVIRDEVENALHEVTDRFSRKDRLDFHNIEHTSGAIERSMGILDALKSAGMEISEKQLEKSKITAAYHDTVQEYDRNEKKNEKGEIVEVMRKRHVGKNEEASAKEAEAAMREANEKMGTDYFTEDDIKEVKEGIMATVPGFNPEMKTVVQPNLRTESPLTARVMALADIGTAGMGRVVEDREQVLTEGNKFAFVERVLDTEYRKEGDALFREENIDIMEALESKQPITEGLKENFKKRMLGWTAFQKDFALGRKKAFERETEVFTEGEREALKKVFCNFDKNAEFAGVTFEKRSTMAFEDLAKDMGYHYTPDTERAAIN